jgi:hypothetical protein
MRHEDALEALEAVKDAKARLVIMQVRLQGNPVLDHLATQVQMALLHLKRAIDSLGGEQ